MSNKCCSGNLQGEINITGGGFKQKIKQTSDSCYVVKIKANQEIYIVTSDRISDGSSSSNRPRSTESDDPIIIKDDSNTNTNLIIVVVILSLLLVLFIGLTIYFGFIRKTKCIS